jgi:hypothetical protein
MYPKPKIVFENFQSALFKSRDTHLFVCDYIDLSVAAAKMASGASGATTKATAAVSATSGSGGPYSALCGQNGMRAAGTLVSISLLSVSTNSIALGVGFTSSLREYFKSRCFLYTTVVLLQLRRRPSVMKAVCS